METYKINEQVICKGKGAAEIIDIVKKDISGEQYKFYILRFFDEDYEVSIPTSNNSSIRKPISQAEIPELFKFLEEKDVEVVKENWNKKTKRYTDKLRNGSIYDIADIIRELNASRVYKKLSFGEKEFYKTAKGLLVQELAVFDNLSKDELNRKVDNCFNEEEWI